MMWHAQRILWSSQGRNTWVVGLTLVFRPCQYPLHGYDTDIILPYSSTEFGESCRGSISGIFPVAWDPCCRLRSMLVDLNGINEAGWIKMNRSGLTTLYWFCKVIEEQFSFYLQSAHRWDEHFWIWSFKNSAVRIEIDALTCTIDTATYFHTDSKMQNQLKITESEQGLHC